MKKMICNLLCGVIIVSSTFISSGEVYADNLSKEVICEKSIIDAENVVKAHIIDVVAKSENSVWSDGVSISNRKLIYNPDGDVVEYYFDLADIDGNPCGYVITGASDNLYPIMEYAENGESFIEEACNKIQQETDKEFDLFDARVIYEGNSTYDIEKVRENPVDVVDISTSELFEKSKEELQYIISERNFDKEWELYQGKGASAPDGKGDLITSPWDYESDDAIRRSFLVTDGYKYYYEMEDFSSGGVCVPTAATNLCMYWYYRDWNNYRALKNNNNWGSTFWELFELMETDPAPDKGTHANKVPNAIEAYFVDRGIGCTSFLSYGTNNGMWVVRELDYDRPVILLMNNHNTYGDHGVLAVGYEQFDYGDSYSTYIRIADGWSHYPDRYVWGACYGTWNYVVVIPN